MANTERLYWHFWHDQLLARTDETLAERRKEIRDTKPPWEKILRLNLIHPARIPKDMLNAWGDVTGRDVILRLHAEQCFADCPWNEELRNIFAPRWREHRLAKRLYKLADEIKPVEDKQ